MSCSRDLTCQRKRESEKDGRYEKGNRNPRKEMENDPITELHEISATLTRTW